MRLWSLHPRYLDPQGLVALWRESLLAKAVLRGETRGYKHHPQLERFAEHEHPRLAINAYLAVVYTEARERGYNFDRSKIGPVRAVAPIELTTGQRDHEWEHLLQKLATRNPALYARWRTAARPECHSLFILKRGSVAAWERVQNPDAHPGT